MSRSDLNSVWLFIDRFLKIIIITTIIFLSKEKLLGGMWFRKKKCYQVI